MVRLTIPSTILTCTALLLTAQTSKGQLLPGLVPPGGLTSPFVNPLLPGLVPPGGVTSPFLNPRLFASPYSPYANPYGGYGYPYGGYGYPYAGYRSPYGGYGYPNPYGANTGVPPRYYPTYAGTARQPYYPNPQPVVVYQACASRQPQVVASENQPVVLNVRVPTADAEVWVEGDKTTQKGLTRSYVSPPVVAGYLYSYKIKARWVEGNRTSIETRMVYVHAGDRQTVDFTVPEEKPKESS